MGLGVNQILQALSYYSVCHTLVENHTPTTGYCMVFLFQCTTIALAVLDLAGLQRHEILVVQIVGVLPCALTAWGVANGDRFESGALDPEETYLLAPLAFVCQIWYLELWLRVAAPSKSDGAKLPRRFRQVLFLDVFGDAKGWDPSQAENSVAPQDVVDGTAGTMGSQDEDSQTVQDVINSAIQEASSQLVMAQWALRRWNAAPEWALTDALREELQVLKEQFTTWGHTMKSEMDHLAKIQGIESPCVFESELRPWTALSDEEQQTDPFAKSLLGPFADEDGYVTRYYHYQLETGKTLFEDDVNNFGCLVLELRAVKVVLHDLENQARRLLELRIMEDMRLETQRLDIKKTQVRDSDPLARLTEALGPTNTQANATGGAQTGEQLPDGTSQGAFVNLVALFQQSNSPAADRSPSVRTELIQPNGSHRSDAASQEEGQALQADQGQSNTRQSPAVAGSTSSSDLTLRAMAGQHAKDFAPERLPWLVLNRLTRMLQLCWGLAGLMTALKELDIFIIDYQEHHGERRQLCVSEPFSFDRVDVEWPHGYLFRPQGIFRPPATSCDELIISSPFGFYHTNVSGTISSKVEELERVRSPWSTTPFCRSWSWSTDGGAERQPVKSAEPCFLAALVPNGLAIWPKGHSHWSEETIAVSSEGGKPWKSFTGGMFNCSDVKEMLSAEESDVRWCLVFVGWDGESLPVAVLPLWSDSLQAVAGDHRLVPRLSVPVSEAARREGIAALHLSAHQGRLWALLASGRFEAWDLFSSTSLGSLKPQWPVNFKTFQVAGLHEDVSGVLFAVGWSELIGPLLFRAYVADKFKYDSVLEEQ